MSARMENVREALDWLDSRAGNLLLQERKSLLVAALLEVEEWEARDEQFNRHVETMIEPELLRRAEAVEARADRLAALLRAALDYTGVDLDDTAEQLASLGAPSWVVAARAALADDGGAQAHSAAVWHRVGQERDALAVQLAHQWGWPDGESVLQRLRGDRTAALTTFCEDALRIYLGVKHDLSLAADGGVELEGGGSSPTPTTGDNSVSAGAQATSGEPPR